MRNFPSSNALMRPNISSVALSVVSGGLRFGEAIGEDDALVDVEGNSRCGACIMPSSDGISFTCGEFEGERKCNPG